MKNKLLGEDISPKCVYCRHGVTLDFSGEVLCEKTGVMQSDSCCKKFRYDPLKRKPAAPKLQGGFSEEDFKL